MALYLSDQIDNQSPFLMVQNPSQSFHDPTIIWQLYSGRSGGLISRPLSHYLANMGREVPEIKTPFVRG